MGISVFERGKQHPEVLVRSFEEAEALRRDFTDGTVLALLYGKLVGPDGDILVVKTSLDEVWPDTSDSETLNVESVIGVHSGISSMILDNLTVAVDSGRQDKSVVA